MKLMEGSSNGPLFSEKLWGRRAVWSPGKPSVEEGGSPGLVCRSSCQITPPPPAVKIFQDLLSSSGNQSKIVVRMHNLGNTTKYSSFLVLKYDISK